MSDDPEPPAAPSGNPKEQPRMTVPPYREFPERDDEAVDRELRELIMQVRADILAGRPNAWIRPDASAGGGE